MRLSGYVLERRFTNFGEITLFKIIQGHRFCNIRKLIYDFLLLINTNVPPILQRFQDIAFDRFKIAIFGYHSYV